MPPIAGGFDAIRARVLARPPSWFEMCAGSAPRHRGYRSGCGGRRTTAATPRRSSPGSAASTTVGPLPQIADPAWTRSPDLAAIRAAEALPAGMPEAERRARVRAIFPPPPATGARFQPFSAEERRLLQAAYAADLERIAGLGPDVLMRF